MKVKYIFFFVILIVPCFSHGQRVFKIYQDDSLSIYFNKLGYETGYYYNIDNLKDSLTDGTYLFYDVNKKDSNSTQKNILTKGQYRNYIKNGEFETATYNYQKKARKYRIAFTHKCNFKDGLKEGVEEKYCYCPFNGCASKNLIFYGVYVDGKKNGLFMIFENGSPVEIAIYEKDKLTKLLLH